MTYSRLLAIGLVLSIAAAPAFAQFAPGPGGDGGLSGGSLGGASAPQPQVRTPDIAPPALPGAALPATPTGPVLSKPGSGDPTTELFAAITKGDDTDAQNALARGADLNAQNQFGETPLDLSIALNRTSITFLLLQTRNELAAQGGNEPIGAPWLLNNPQPAPHASLHRRAEPVSAPVSGPQPIVTLPEEDGTPNPQAGFLGFGSKE